ncbi:putative inorganic phosphate cotransporter isoform X1 [Diorhabda sublineata]|uniref:putative inorganic phosphate cotransporter isoform X1 n=1 Tax=Diorhabda sublineata TaxID=1163346 RepID=UPI0024E0D192|nr:putative inorganic phosphate cotransporter isoform X1 [Diorhabda sublineata]
METEDFPKQMQSFPKPASFFGIRHLQYVLMFTGAIVVYGMRTVLIVAIVAMIETYPDWKPQKNIILSSFSWGHVWFQIGSGQLAKNYGPKYFLTAAIAISATCILVIPWFSSEFGYKSIIAIRALEGACHGVLFPSVHNLLSKWAPISERAQWGSFVYAGQVLGNCLAMPITGFISDSKAGWPVAFYFYGFCGLLWTFLWFIFGSNSPDVDTRISEAEKMWLKSQTIEKKVERPPTPWKSIFTSVPFIAVIITHCGQNWGFWTLLTEIPSFMKSVMGYSIAKGSILSALPYFIMWIMNLMMSPIADFIIARGFVTLITSRKIFNSIGFFIPALALISISLIDSDNKVLIETILIITVAFNAGHYCGFNINHIDLSPVFAGTLIGITNTISAIFTIMAPLAVDAVKSISGYEETDKELWNIIFWISAGFYTAAGCVFIFFGSGEIQPWNNVNTDNSVP